VDPATWIIQLDDGTMYTVAEGVALDTLQPGTEVTVSFEDEERSEDRDRRQAGDVAAKTGHTVLPRRVPKLPLLKAGERAKMPR